MKRQFAAIVAAATTGIICSSAVATLSITQQAAPAPTYAITLNFDEPAGPTGADVPNNSWVGAAWQIPIFQSGTGNNFVGDLSGATGQGTNAYDGPFGVFINFASDLSAMSFQGWDNSGPPSGFGGGAAVIALKNGVEVGSIVVTPAWGGAGNSWYNLTTTGGTVFDEVRFLGFSFSPESVVDNLSWNAVPEPASLSILAIGCAAILRRRAK